MRLSEPQAFGFQWEKWVLDQLHLRGYTDARLLVDYKAHTDIMLGTMPIEVKAARPRNHFTHCYRTRWQFDTSRLPRQIDHVVILVALDFDQRAYPFIVPSWLIGDRYNVHITSHPTKFKGLLAPCLEAWGNVASVKLLHDHYAGQLALEIMGTVSSKNNPISTAPNPHFGMGTGDTN